MCCRASPSFCNCHVMLCERCALKKVGVWGQSSRWRQHTDHGAAAADRGKSAADGGQSRRQSPSGMHPTHPYHTTADASLPAAFFVCLMCSFEGRPATCQINLVPQRDVSAAAEGMIPVSTDSRRHGKARC